MNLGFFLEYFFSSFDDEFFLLGERKNLLNRVNQQETKFSNFGSSETKREAFLNRLFLNLIFLNLMEINNMDFTKYYQQTFKHLSRTKKKRKQYEHFLSWLIGFIEGDGSYYTNQRDTILEDLNSSLLTTDSLSQPKRLSFEITQIDAKLLFFIRKNLGFGLVYPFKHENRTYYRYYTSKKENILKLLALMNGNLVLEKRQKQFQQWLSIINQKWSLSIPLKSWNQVPSLENGWISGFVEADGGFYTNVGTGFKKSGGYFNYIIKMYITQKGEKPALTSIRDLFGATTSIQQFRNPEKCIDYFRLEICSLQAREQIIDYFTKFSLKGIKNIDYERWVRIHGYQKNNIRLKTSRSATKLQRLILSLEEHHLLEFFTTNPSILRNYISSDQDSAVNFLINQGFQEKIANIKIEEKSRDSFSITHSFDTEDSLES